MRRRDWERRLLDWADGLIGTPFVWGVTDCHALALQAFAVMYDRPRLQSPVWATEWEALALLATGWTAPEALAALGAAPVPPGYVQRGDILVEPPKDTQIHGVLVALGEGRFLTAYPGEVVYIATRADLDPAATCWRWV